MAEPTRAESEAGAAATERLVRLGDRHLTWPELCSRADVEDEVADRLWRALGFPDVPPDEPAYTDDDVRALALAAQGLDQLDGSRREEAIELLVREARAVSAYLTRISEIQVDALFYLREYGLRGHAIADGFEHGLQDSELGWLLMYGLRRRLDDTLRRRATHAAGDQSTLAVGFVDLVDFTRTSGSLDVEEFGDLLNSFEALVWDIVTEAGGQVVKLIGDEAMFVCPSAAEAARAALGMIGESGRAELPPSRGGLAVGPLLLRGGDYFGPAVNLASRLVDKAEPGTVLIDRAFRDQLEGGAFELRELGPLELKGIGEVPSWRLGPGRGVRAA
jgi:adenylate cyclase